MKFHVNADCIGCGLCVSTCPEVFTMAAPQPLPLPM